MLSYDLVWRVDQLWEALENLVDFTLPTCALEISGDSTVDFKLGGFCGVLRTFLTGEEARMMQNRALGAVVKSSKSFNIANRRELS